MTAPPPRTPPGSSTARRRHLPAPVWLSFTVVLLLAPAARADRCADALDGELRRALQRSVHRSLSYLDDDRRRWRDAYGPAVLRNGGHVFFDNNTDDRRFCLPSVGEHHAISNLTWGAEGHFALGDLRLRSIALETELSQTGGWSLDAPRPRFEHAVFGAFVGYGEWIEAGLLRAQRIGGTVPGNGTGWMASVASHGVRLTTLLGDDEPENFTLDVGPLPVGPLHVTAGGRYLVTEALPTAYLELHRFTYAGSAQTGGHVDARAEMELSTGRLRSLHGRMSWTVEWDDSASASPWGTRKVRRARKPKRKPKRVPYRFFLDASIAGSLAAGSQIEDRGAVGGWAIASEFGVFGRGAGVVVGGRVVANDPWSLETRGDTAHTINVEGMLRIKVGAGE